MFDLLKEFHIFQLGVSMVEMRFYGMYDIGSWILDICHIFVVIKLILSGQKTFHGELSSIMNGNHIVNEKLGLHTLITR